MSTYSPIYNLIFHKYVLFIEFKLNLKVCNLNTIDSSLLRISAKILLAIIVFIVAIFLIEKIKFPSPNKKFDIDITNDIKKL